MPRTAVNCRVGGSWFTVLSPKPLLLLALNSGSVKSFSLGRNIRALFAQQAKLEPFYEIILFADQAGKIIGEVDGPDLQAAALST